ncbi:hypothetical protein K523DRAFT_164587, partial [Schizophyllum commune Tattone D]
QKRRHIFKTTFPTSYRPQCAADASRIRIKRLSQVPPFNLLRSAFTTQVTTDRGYSGRVCIYIHLASTLNYDKSGRVPCPSTPSGPSTMLQRCAWDMSGPIVGAGGYGE